VSHQRYPGLYGAFMNPHFLSGNGRTIYFVMSQWDVYSVFWMKASLSIRRSTDSVSAG
jgi:hypothetical protein